MPRKSGKRYSKPKPSSPKRPGGQHDRTKALPGTWSYDYNPYRVTKRQAASRPNSLPLKSSMPTATKSSIPTRILPAKFRRQTLAWHHLPQGCWNLSSRLRICSRTTTNLAARKASLPRGTSCHNGSNREGSMTTVESLTDKALDAFFHVIVEHFPQAESGELSPGATIALHGGERSH